MMKGEAGRPLKLYIVAGEASGDALGGRLMAGLKRLADRPVEFHGIGGTQMQAEGLSSLFPMQELSVMGLVEILPHARQLLRRLDETAADIRRVRPDAIITIDAPGFNRRLVDRVRPRSIPRIHYVAPTVWAWRPKRALKFKARFDRLLALLPFEPPWFEKVGLDCRFVGHSVLESGADKGDGAAFRMRHGLAEGTPLLCLLPGSRRGEITRLLPDFTEAVHLLGQRRPGLQVAIPIAPGVTDMVRQATAGWSTPPILVEGAAEKFDCMAACDAALAASGTVALELALARAPTVIAYKLPAITYAIVKSLVTVDFAHLLNIMARQAIVPEHIQGDCRPALLAADLDRLMGQAGADQVDALQPYLQQLWPPGGELPSEAAARAVLELV